MENLVPRKPGKVPNDKRMNKREPTKAHAKPLQLHPAVPADKYASQKADQPKQAYQGRQSHEEAHYSTTTRTLGAPVEPVSKGANMEEQPNAYQPKTVSKYSADTAQNIDGEDMSLHVISGKVAKPTGPVTELRHAHGRLPDEFHNTEFEQRNPHLIHPVHYDHYEPQVEGFFGAGYNFEPMERQHYFVHETAGAFTPGHFTPGEYEGMPSQYPYHQDVVMGETMYGPSYGTSYTHLKQESKQPSALAQTQR